MQTKQRKAKKIVFLSEVPIILDDIQDLQTGQQAYRSMPTRQG
jgi:hypothetical protein